MKKSSYEAIYAALSSINYANENPDVMDELYREIHRNDERKAKSAQEYDSIHDLIISTLGDTPITFGELYEALEGKLPNGITKGRVQYALSHLWKDEIVTTAGKPNTYHRA